MDPLDRVRGGSSAGSTILLSLVQMVTGCQFTAYRCITGELTPNGMIQAVGDIDIKAKAAQWYGLELVLPKANQSHLEEALRNGVITADLKVHYVENVLELFEATLVGK